MKYLQKSKAVLNYATDMLALIPFIMLLSSGIIMLGYHGGKAYDTETLGLNGDSWISIHKTLTIIALPLVLLHLTLHFNWIRKLFTFQLTGKHKRKNLTLFILFLTCMTTSLLSWTVFDDTDTALLLRGLHNKIGLLLIVFFVIHIIVYFKWIVGMTRKVFRLK